MGDPVSPSSKFTGMESINEQSPFQVDASGKLTLKQPISHTDHPNITFTIVAVDNGIPSLNDTATVFINVIDQNTHRPEFVQDFYNVEERADAQVGDTVTTIMAIDLDLGIVGVMFNTFHS